ncbi:hypothetical protein OF83DRAFT_591242 [Amylostereum chailletii]|nr:hypothetical protein OF83DRAFT_591242 [Amylostereum chailletii]
MDAKLKTLKVADLKEILSGVCLPSNSRTKADLVARILDNPLAIDAYRAKYDPAPAPKPAPPPVDDLLAPPEEIDWTIEDPVPPVPEAPSLSPTPANVPPTSTPAQAPPSTDKASTQPPSNPDPSSEAAKLKTRAERFGIPESTAPAADVTPTVSDDPEELKRKARAERFKIPLVQPKPPRPQRATSRANAKPSTKVDKSVLGDPKASSKLLVDSKKLEERAARFNLQSTKKNGALKRAAAEEVDAEEQERRRKRAERFALPPA